MKTVVHDSNARDKLLHIEAEGCVVNIRVGLTDRDGREVTSIEILPDRYAGEEWDLDGAVNNRVIRRRPCRAARTGDGYWVCDVPGGCEDCRRLAREIEDTEQFAQWADVEAGERHLRETDPERTRE